MDISKLVIALAPAFAAGFALQRLLEILDPIFDKPRIVKSKKIVFSLISFFAGLGLALSPKIRVLTQLVTPDTVPSLLDYFVTALIVSGGTEGFNSILKFLNYKKEETKGESVTKAITATTAQAMLERSVSMANRSVSPLIAVSEFVTSGDLSTDLAAAFKEEIIKRFPDQFREDGWDERPFGEFVDDMTLFKMQDAASDATNIVAAAFGVQLSNEAHLRIQKRVTTKSTPKKVLPTMENEVASA